VQGISNDAINTVDDVVTGIFDTGKGLFYWMMDG
jgi:hypothetical protein